MCWCHLHHFLKKDLSIHRFSAVSKVTQTAMELLPLVCVSLLTWSGTTFAADGGILTGPDAAIKAAAKAEIINGTKVIRVKEGRDVTLPCSLSTKEDITHEKFEWQKDDRQVFLYDKGTVNDNSQTQDQQFKGRVSYFPDELKSGNASIIIRNMKVVDSEKYTCNFPNRPGEIFLVVLVAGSASGLVAGSVLKLFLLMVFLVFLF